MHTFKEITLHDIRPEGLFQENFVGFEVACKRVHDRFDLELGNVSR